MEESVIKDLYCNYIQQSSKPRKYYYLLDNIDKNNRKLYQNISKKDKKMLQTICDNYDEVLIYEAQSGFYDGFSCAVKILSEAYANK